MDLNKKNSFKCAVNEIDKPEDNNEKILILLIVNFFGILQK